MNLDRLTTPFWSLRVVLGAAAFLAGLDKFFNLLADWPAYLSPLAANLLPISSSSFMHIVSLVEMAVAAFTLARLTEAGVVSAHASARSTTRLDNTRTITA